MASLLDLREGLPEVRVTPGGVQPSNDLSEGLEPVTPDPVPALRSTIDRSPDEAAKINTLSKESGIEAGTVRQNPQSVEQSLRINEINSLVADRPVTQQFISDPARAELAHDDVESLSTVELLGRELSLRTPAAAAQAFAAGILEVPGRSIEGLSELYDVYARTVGGLATGAVEGLFGQEAADTISPDIVPWYLNPTEIINRPGRAIREGADAIGPAPEDQNFVTDVAGGLGQIGSQITLALLTGGASSITSLTSLLGQGASLQADQVREAGAEGTPEGDAAIVAGAGITALTEKVGLDVLLNRLPANVKSKINRILIGAGSEASQEIVENVLQNLTALGLYDPETQVFDGAAYEGSVAGTVGAITQMIIPGRQAIQTKNTLDQINETLTDSPVAKRAPDEAAAHVKQVLEANNVPEVYVPAKELAKWISQQDAPDSVLFGLGVQNTIEEAIALGQDVTIENEAFSRYILMSDKYDGISEHIRTDVDGMTAFEANELAETGLEDEVNEIIAKTEIPRTEDEKILDVAETEMGLRGMFRTADEAGMTPAKYEQYLAALEAAETQRRQAFGKSLIEQRARENSAEINTIRDRVREQVREDLNTLPQYQVLNGIGKDRIDRQQAAEMLGRLGLSVDSIPRQQGNRQIVTPKGQQGLSPDTVAELYGFEDGETMMAVLAKTPDFVSELNRTTEQRTRNERPELFSRHSELLLARQAFHNDKQTSLLKMELDALRDAQKKKKLSTNLIKRAARQRIASYPLHAITPTKFLTAHSRLAKQASRAIKKGDVSNAADFKFQQLLNFEMAKMAYTAQQKIQKQEAYLKKARKPSQNMPVVYQQAITQLLNQVTFGPRFSRKNTDALKKVANSTVDPVTVDKDLQDPASRQNVRNMTLTEFTNLHNTVKEIEKKGRSENKLRLSTEKRERDVIAAFISDGIQKNLGDKKRRKKLNEERGKWESAKRWGREARALLFNADTILREMDGFENLGVAYSNIKGRYDRAISGGYDDKQKGYLPRQKEVAANIVKLYSVYSKKERLGFNRTFNVPGLNQKISRHTMLSVMLNTGNDGNYQALIESGTFTAPEIKAIQEFASKKDWDFVQSVWDYMGSFWQEIKSKEESRRNYSPEGVEATSIKTKHGDYKGGYYPIRYDRRSSSFITETDTKAMLDDMRYGRYASSHTARGHTEARNGPGKGNKVLLDLHVINSHLDQVIYDLEVGDAVTDMYKVLYHPDVKKSFAEVGAQHKWESLDLWLRDVVTGEIGKSHPLEAGLRYLRTGFTISRLAWNFGTIALQPLGLIQSSVVLGKPAMWHGMRVMHSTPWVGKNSIFAFVESQSKFMQERGATWNKDVLDAQKQLSDSLLDRVTPGKTADIIRDSFFYGIKKTQRYVDTITWLSAKNKGMQEFDGDEQRANEFADRMVARSQASGIFGERTALERGSVSSSLQQTELVRAFTPLISYFMAKTNVTIERTKKTNFRNPGEIIGWLSDMMLLYTVEALLAGLIRGQWPDEDDDETFIEYTAKESINSVLAGVPIIREFGSEAQGFTGGGIVATTADAFGKWSKQASQGEVDMALFRATNNLGGILFKYPSSQINKTVGAIVKSQNEDVGPMEFIMGPHFDR